ncbi:MAG: DoxX family protein [Saprospiraceae bacterium]|nr:DoxX family protein [Saprospiraceae bacterium]
MKSNVIRRVLDPHPTIISQDSILLVFRVLVSLAMINTHGIKKLIYFSDTVENIPDPFGLGGEISAYIAIMANIISPILVIVGLATRLAALQILSVTVIGFFVVHAEDPWAVKDVPLMYSLAYLLIFFFGAGKYSLDHSISKKWMI